MLVFFGGKVFSFDMPDHAKPGFRHVTPHLFLSRIFCGVSHPTAFCPLARLHHTSLSHAAVVSE
jgi:hypothetical protein